MKILRFSERKALLLEMRRPCVCKRKSLAHSNDGWLVAQVCRERRCQAACMAGQDGAFGKAEWCARGGRTHAAGAPDGAVGAVKPAGWHSPLPPRPRRCRFCGA